MNKRLKTVSVVEDISEILEKITKHISFSFRRELQVLKASTISKAVDFEVVFKNDDVQNDAFFFMKGSQKMHVCNISMDSGLLYVRNNHYVNGHSNTGS